MSFEKFKQELLEDPETRAEYEKLKPEFDLIREMIKARKNAGLTQDEVAERMGVTQPAVARLESAKAIHSPSFRTLRKYAEIVGCDIEIKLVSKQ